MPPVLLHPILGHQGGWDEMLLVAAPIAVLALILWLANRRAARLQESRDPDEEQREEPDGAEHPEAR